MKSLICAFTLAFFVESAANSDGESDLDGIFKTALSADDSCAAHDKLCSLSLLQLLKLKPSAEREIYPPLLHPSKGKVSTFYMYRAQGKKDYSFENVNAANLEGVMWYLQNEIVSGKWGSTDRFGIDRIARKLVTMKPTQSLVDKKMSFGLRVSFDSGQCTNKGCDFDWWRYGYNVGCNNLGQYPFPMFETYYPGGVWYSLPGKCPSRTWNNRTAECQKAEPGGLCEGTPTGTGNCTYSYEDAGFITLEDLYASTKQTSKEFWANPNSTAQNQKRVQAANEYFKAKYPKSTTEEDLKAPPCDFDRDAFYKCSECI